MKTIIATDMDGCLLDPETYRYDEALSLIEQLKSMGVDIVLASSKTRFEILLYQDRLGITSPYIAENGGYNGIPSSHSLRRVLGEKVVLGTPVEKILADIEGIIEEYRGKIKIHTGFTPEEFSLLTGLPLYEAVLALYREYSVIAQILDKDVAKDFCREVSLKGYRCSMGGRFLSIMGRHDKGVALEILLKGYRELYGDIYVIGIGDSPNDEPLLRVVDTPIVLGNKALASSIPGSVFIEERGPTGWKMGVELVLNKSL